MFDLRLIRAEVLKLRRRRGMLAIVAGITLGVVALAFGVSAIQHAGNPAKYGPAGGAAAAQGDAAAVKAAAAKPTPRPRPLATSSTSTPTSVATTCPASHLLRDSPAVSRTSRRP